jgi:hypothetical protein
MPEFRLTKNEEVELDKQFEEWKQKINFYVGPPVLSVAVTAFASPSMRLVLGWLGLLVLIAAFVAIKRKFPIIFKELRSKDRSYKEEIIYRGIGSYYFSLKRSLIHFPLYILAVFLLIAALANMPSIWGY